MNHKPHSMTTNAPSQTERVYYYRPCQFDNGQTFKCAGHGAEKPEHRAFYLPHFDSPVGLERTYLLPGVVMLQGYHGDQIPASYAKTNALQP